MLKKLASELGLEVSEEMTDEEIAELIKSKNTEKDEHITTLESEKKALSDSVEELNTSVEGYKSNLEKTEKERDDAKTELATTKGKLEQVTDMYKEQFSKNPEEEQDNPSEKELVDDVLRDIIGVN